MSRAIVGTKTRVAGMKAAGTRVAEMKAAGMKAVTKETGGAAKAGDARTEIGADQPLSPFFKHQVAIGGTVSCRSSCCQYHAASEERRVLLSKGPNLLAGWPSAYPLFFCDR